MSKEKFRASLTVEFDTDGVENKMELAAQIEKELNAGKTVIVSTIPGLKATVDAKFHAIREGAGKPRKRAEPESILADPNQTDIEDVTGKPAQPAAAPAVPAPQVPRQQPVGNVPVSTTMPAPRPAQPARVA